MDRTPPPSAKPPLDKPLPGEASSGKPDSSKPPSNQPEGEASPTRSARPIARLVQIQRWMQAVITHPAGVEAGIEGPEARAEINISPQRVDEVGHPSSRRTSIERLEVYANAYYARLLECLADEFPALLHAAGQEAFDELAFGYLQSHPSTSYTLSDLSRRFAEFLEQTRPPADEGLWPDFLIDLVRLERTYSEIFDGPGAERLRLLSAEQIQAIPPDEWPSARLVSVPCPGLLGLRYPVCVYATAGRKQRN